jgi:hypothetical protein
VGLVYDPREMLCCQTQIGRGVTNGIRADPCDFIGAYGPVEKDTVVYGLKMWVHTHYVWVLWKGHGMVYMLLIGRTVCVCQY